ncbi:DUF2141 domain-containing protein [filamentous cyanobacterium LEGE 11480]|uniref:DUF2141 domain-containing protein n=1 Tax=Romeriopsis navalis LEGE 11480 TaxID=2777977 RepID=A0A928VQR7_9CYAN|nr:DUF2141 domain-containing protein [Romeriopsis navalis]MBE9032022.1 DUF2141 domain-containing protein [Romeriopsis navalis LEGE 11480]
MLGINRLTHGLVLGVVSLPLWALQPAQAASTLSVEIDGLRSRKGQVCLSIFNSSRGFPANGDNALRSQCVRVKDKKSLKVSFRGLKAGSYAVAVLHDENADGQANRNIIGIPTEGFGFSRNPGLRAGPPKFGEAAFLAAGSRTAIQVRMRYLF